MISSQYYGKEQKEKQKKESYELLRDDIESSCNNLETQQDDHEQFSNGNTVILLWDMLKVTLFISTLALHIIQMNEII